MEILSQETWLKRIQKEPHPVRQSYKAMYSTWWNGIVTDPNLMMIPIDDHQVHRGDGVFEAFKAIEGKVYLLREHLDRLDRSAKFISLNNPYSRDHMVSVIKDTLAASGVESALLRMFLGRGPGSFTANPYDTMGTQLHVVVTEFKGLSDQKVKEGVSLAASKIPVKESWLAQIKSCNYINNVLMKKEAVDLGVDFTIGIDSDGFLTEGSTENLIVLTKDRDLIRPYAKGILAGTTMLRIFELAQAHKKQLGINTLCERAFTVDDLTEAEEVMMVGTTLDVLSVVKFENKVIGSGLPGAVCKELRNLLIADQLK